MKLIPILLILLCTISCTNHHLKPNTQIVAKYITLDDKLSPKHTKCSSDIKQFEKMNEYDCSFLIENYEFDIETKYILNEKGNLAEYWVYKSEGPLTYYLAELKSDPKFLNMIGGAELNISLLENGTQIMNRKDTLTIETIFRKQKIILIKQKEKHKKNNRRILFEYK